MITTRAPGVVAAIAAGAVGVVLIPLAAVALSASWFLGVATELGGGRRR